MPRKFLNKLMPDRQKLRARLSGKWYVRPFRKKLYDPALWHVNRHGSTGAIAIGLFICCLPIPGHMLLAVLAAFYWRLNLPLAVLTVWFNNPLTFGAIYYGNYRLGALLLHVHHHPFPRHLSFDWLFMELSRIWEPLWLGCIVGGMLLALIGYVTLSVLWQVSIRMRWRKRARLRAAQKSSGRP
ncbi:MAG TPA: DUF2062 domain-containing protein [Gammaproteobacteria bacterium]|nr:DUF2062 domain-containing protein [Gammaproteobacteria bacterium]